MKANIATQYCVVILLHFTATAIFCSEIQFSPYPPPFHLEFQDDYTGEDRCFFATR